MIGWLIAGALIGAVATTAIVAFWDDIREWLNSVAADAVEKAFGYSARNRMHRAVAKVNRVINKIRNNTVVYTKRNSLDEYYDKTTIIAEDDVYNIGEDVVKEINKKGEIVQEYKYNA